MLQKIEKNYISLILIHLAVGLAIYVVHPLGKMYLPIVAVLGFFWILKNENKNNEVLYVCGYIVGAEAIYRMTGDFFIFEFGKYSILFFCLMGVFFSGMSKKSSVYLLFLTVLLPAIVLGAYTLSFQTDVRKNIVFNVFGPVTLAISAIYCYEKRLTLKEMNNLLFVIGLPIVATAFYLLLYSPSVKDVVTGTSSNFETSGGFGPNQVSTILGLGCFVFFTRLLLESRKPLFFIVNMVLFFYISFRGLITFSRGGMITAAVMIVVLLFIVFRSVNTNAKNTLILFLFLSMISFVGIWTYTSSQTNGLIENRYANKDALGRVKKSKMSGREDISASEIDMFLENPVFGVGVGKGREVRADKGMGIGINSHNELTRMLGEHGSFGVIGLFILFVVPLRYYFTTKSVNFNFYAIPAILFWLLTLNHAGMRLAAPAFIYALSLLNIYAIDNEEPVVHRE